MKMIVFKSVAAGVGCISALGLLEIFTRLFIPQIKYEPPRFLYVSDPVRGYKHATHFNGTWTTEFGAVHVQTDRYGFRNPDRERGQDSQTILVLGDSFTFAPELEQEQAFPALISDATHRGLCVYNAGVNGYGTAQQVQLLRDMIADIQPAVVLLAFYMNDLRDNLYETERGPTRIVQDGYLVPASDPDRRPRPHFSQAWALLTNRTELLLNRYFKPRSHLRPVMKGMDASSQKARSITVKALGEFADLCRRCNARPVVMTIPSGRQSRPWLYEAFPVSTDELDIEQPQRIVNEACIAHSILHVNLLQTFRTIGEQQNCYFGEEGHWNAAGHQRAAEALLPVLFSLLAKSD